MIDSSKGLRVGVAQIDITPPVGMAMTGFIARMGDSIGVHDPLYAKALVFDDGEQRAALVICDVLAFDRHFVSAARASIEAATGFPGAHVMIAGTHTHSGPATIFLRDCGGVDAGWLDALRQRLAEVMRLALSNLQPARLGSGRGEQAAVAQNRRRSGDTFDPDLGLLRIDDARGQTMAVLLNFACHPTTLRHDNRLFSADYPGYATRRVADASGAPALFATGAIGNVGPIDEGDYPQAAALGTALADEALRVLPGIVCAAGARVTVASELLHLPLLAPPAIADLEQAVVLNRQRLSETEPPAVPWMPRVHRAMLGWAEETLAEVTEGRLRRSVPAEVQVIRLGNVALVGVPGELFVELGLAIKRGIGAEQTVIVGYANDDIGYLPTRPAYAHGGYEILDAYKYYGYPAALAPEAGEEVVAAAIRLT
jgi:hypothetical protein